MLVRKKFVQPFFICPEKICDSEINFHLPPPPTARQHFLEEKTNSSKGLIKKKKTNTAKHFEKKWTTPPITFLMVHPLPSAHI